MKSPSTHPTTRRPAASRRQVRLDLRRVEPRRTARGDDERDGGSSFWFWAGIVALFHVIVLAIVAIAYHSSATTPPPEPFISLLPQGETSQGTPGQQAAPKLGATTPAPAPTPRTATPPAKPQVTPPEKPLAHTKPKPKPAPTALADKPAPVEHKPEPPKPKVKVDLTLADGPEDEDTPAPKPKPHLKKAPVHPATDTDATDADAAPASTGLSKEEVAEKLGAKLSAAGVDKAPRVSTSGSPDSRANDFSDFYAAIRDQVLSKWQSPNLTDETAVFPIVQIHVEDDGRVPPEQVKLVQSSGNAEYDDSALAVARNVGYLLQPLPPKCPPDIQITFKLTR